MMIDFEHWIEMIQYELDIQKDPEDYCRLRLNRKEAIELRMMIETLKDMLGEQSKE